MPWPTLSNLSDVETAALYRYIRSLASGSVPGDSGR
jgi:hypothetical protein